MIARLWKETRALLPLFLGTLGVTSMPLLVGRYQLEPLVLVALAFGCAVMAASSFGSEFQQRTISLWLSQPLARRVLWREKMVVLGVAMLLSFVVAWLSLWQWRNPWGVLSEPAVIGVLALIPLCTFCGAPYLTLLTRSSIAGVVFGLSIPFAISTLGRLLTFWLDRREESAILAHHEETAVLVAAALLLIYCALCLWRGYTRFQKLEVIDGPVREVSFPAAAPAWVARASRPLVTRLSGAFGMLIRKELALQQMSFLSAGVFCAVVAAAALLYWFRRDWGEPLLVVEFALYVGVLPFLVGALAVAEERGWGLAEWHQTLPPSAFKQWAAKMLVTLSTSLVLGLLLPRIFFLGISALLGKPDFDFPPNPLEALASLALGYALLTTLAAYAGSFTKSTLAAILLGIALALALLGCFRLVPLFGTDFSILYGVHRSLPASIKPGPPSVPEAVIFVVLIGCFQRYGFANHRRAGLPAGRIVLQIIWLLAVSWLLICILTLAWIFS